MNSVIVLLPELRHCGSSSSVRSPTLTRWLAQADLLAGAEAGDEALLREVFTWSEPGLPIAALTRQFDVGDAGVSIWLRTDPAHVRADMATARMFACGDLGLSRDETDAIERDLKPLFADAGFVFEATTPSRWYLRHVVDADSVDMSSMPTFSAPDDALGDDLKLHLPADDSGRRWRNLLNECQILLHNHPVSAARNARGAVAINSLWFWGSGVLPSEVRSRVTNIISDDIVVAALANLAGVNVTVSESGWRGVASARQAIDLRTTQPSTLELQWLQPLDSALHRGEIGSIDIALRSDERLRMRSRHRWRFWRRTPGSHE